MWHGKPTKFNRGDLITHPNNPGVLCYVLDSTKARIMGVMGWIVVQIQDDPGWIEIKTEGCV